MISKKLFLMLLFIASQLAMVATAQTAQTTEAKAPKDLDLSMVTETDVEIVDVSNLAVPGKTYVAATIMNASIQRLCSVIMNYPDYPLFMPNTERTTVLSTSDDATLVEMLLRLPLGKTKRYRLKMTPTVAPQSCQVAWKLVPTEGLQQSETITDTSGYWLFTPDPKDASKTLVKYFVFADPGPIPFGLGWIVDMMTRISLPRTLEALRERVTVK